MTHEQKIKAITTDFLERDGDKFVKIRRNGRLGWEDTIPAYGAYSERITRGLNTKIDQYTYAFNCAKDMLKIMGVSNRVHLNVSRVTESSTNALQMNISTKVFNDRERTYEGKLDVFIGDTVHEASHVLFSDFNLFTDNKVLNNLANIVEDERIERATCEKTPGLACFLGQSKYYHFDTESKEIVQPNYLNETQKDFYDLFNSILALIRYPKLLTPELVDKYADELLETKQILTPYPTSTQESFDAAAKLLALLMKYAPKDEQTKKEEEEKEEEEQQQQESRQGNSSDSQQENENDEGEGKEQQEQSSEINENGDDQTEKEDGDSSGDKDTDSDSSSQSDDNQEQLEGNDEQGDEQDDEQGGEQDDEDGEDESSSKAPMPELSEDEKQEIIKALCEATQGSDIGKDNDISDDIRNDNYDILQSVFDGSIHISSDGKLQTKMKREEKSVYEAAREKVSPYIASIRKALTINSTELQFVVRGNRSGRLDPNRMVEGIQGVDTVYTKQGEVKSDKVNVVILIDESGSMHGDKLKAARNASVLLAEAMKDLKNINLFVYGHTSTLNTYYARDGRNVLLNVYIEGDLRKRRTLGTLDAFGKNFDSRAIEEVVRRVRTKTSDDCLMIVISDGLPNEPFEQVKKAVTDAQRQGFDVLAIGIESGLDLNSVYPKSLMMTDLSSFAKDLSKLIKGTVLGKTNRRLQS